MTIERNGVKITLLEEDLDFINQLIRRRYMKEDVKSHIQNLGLDFEPDDSDLEAISDRAETALRKSDPYFEAYWLAIEDAIMAYIEEGSQ